MQSNNWIYLILYFLVTLIVAWIAFSLILLWAKPAFYTAGGAVNWGVTFWVSLVVILLAWAIMLVLYWLVKLFFGKKKNGGGCGKKEPACGCEVPAVTCYDKCGRELGEVKAGEMKQSGGWMGMGMTY
jgi:membrane protein implicated in regulation of membrane protease activity